MTIKQAVILAGGQGARLRPLTNEVPKPMVAVRGKPFLDYLMFQLMEQGIERVTLLLGYKADVAIEYYEARRNPKLKVDFSVGAVEDLTGRRVLNAHDMLDEYFLLMYGDNYWPLNLQGIASAFKPRSMDMTTTVFKNIRATGEYGRENNVQVKNGAVVRYDKSRKAPGLNGVDIGFFLVRRCALDFGIRGNISFEEAILPSFVARGALGAFETDEQYYFITDLGSLERFSQAATSQSFQSMIWS